MLTFNLTHIIFAAIFLKICNWNLLLYEWNYQNKILLQPVQWQESLASTFPMMPRAVKQMDTPGKSKGFQERSFRCANMTQFRSWCHTAAYYSKQDTCSWMWVGARSGVVHSENVWAEVRTRGEKTKIAGLNGAMLHVREVSRWCQWWSSHVFITLHLDVLTLSFRCFTAFWDLFSSVIFLFYFIYFFSFFFFSKLTFNPMVSDISRRHSVSPPKPQHLISGSADTTNRIISGSPEFVELHQNYYQLLAQPSRRGCWPQMWRVERLSRGYCLEKKKRKNKKWPHNSHWRGLEFLL